MIRHFDAADMAARLPPAAAVASIERALRNGLDPASGIPRVPISLPAGDLLLMPAASPSYVGVKLVTVAPGNPHRALPRIHAVYALFHADTLTPAAFLDGTALTTMRTPAVSVAAVRPVLPTPARTVVFGAGPQARSHLSTLRAVPGVSTVDVVVRTPAQADATALTEAAGTEVRVHAADAATVVNALRTADVVVCATTAQTPLFDSACLPGTAVVIAVGSHTPTAREVDASWCRRARVVVEDRATALQESGDIIQAIEEGALTEAALIPMRDAVLTPDLLSDAPVLFKGSGMAWQDLTVAEAILAQAVTS